MTKKNVVVGIVLPIIAGLFLILSAISTWAFEEKSLTAQEQLEKAKQESELFNLGIQSTQRDDSLPGLKISDPDAKTPIGVDNIVCWGEGTGTAGL